jgi:hypothetical protein
MSLIKLRHASLTALLFAPLSLWGCNDDGSSTTTEEGTSTGTAETDGSGPESGDNDADAGDGDGDGGDGDGDGDGGDGDGDAGDGDGDGGDGDGDGGDGDGDGDGGDGDGDGDGGDGDGDGDGGDGDGDPGECVPQDAQGQGLCDLFLGWAWNGMECVPLSGCQCVGTDCGNLYMEPAECENAYADCGGQPGPCADLNLQMCQNNMACMPINGQMLVESNQGICLEQSEFIACDEQAFCAEVLTWACDINATKYLFNNSCIPDGFMPCDPPNVDPQGC